MHDHETIEGPVAWTGGDFPSDRSWVRRFDDAMIAEIEAAAQKFLADGTDPRDVRKHDFALPKSEAVLR